MLPGAFDAMLDSPVWVAWDSEGGRKVPKSPHGGNAKSNDPSTWGTYAEAEAARAKKGYSGVGIMLTDGLVGIDLDHAYGGDGELLPWARDIVDELGCYTERSPSGTGVHILAYAGLDEVGPIGRRAGGVEVYNNRRYFTVTGDVVEDRPIYDLTDEMPGFVARHFPGESPEQAVRRRVGDLAASQVKRRANQTMLSLCDRDGLSYARVPTGSETCGFCLMLASRGFVYRSEETAGGREHFHYHCDCKVVPGFEGLTEVEGYDPDALRGVYAEARSRVEGVPTGAAISREIEAVLAARRSVGDGEYGPRRSVGAAYSSAYEARDRAAAKADTDHLKQSQFQHIKGTPQYNNAIKTRGRRPSYFTLTADDLKALIKRHIGHGEPVISNDTGEWTGKEVCVADQYVGYIIVDGGTREVPTRYFKVHYGKDGGVHAVPAFDEGGGPDVIR